MEPNKYSKQANWNQKGSQNEPRNFQRRPCWTRSKKVSKKFQKMQTSRPPYSTQRLVLVLAPFLYSRADCEPSYGELLKTNKVVTHINKTWFNFCRSHHSNMAAAAVNFQFGWIQKHICPRVSALDNDISAKCWKASFTFTTLVSKNIQTIHGTNRRLDSWPAPGVPWRPFEPKTVDLRRPKVSPSCVVRQS